MLDLFGGSGSTLIACEQTNRVCRMVELDEKFCDVIVKRYIEQVGSSENVTVQREGLGVNELPIEKTEEKVTFPWFKKVIEDADAANAYIHFVYALCEMAHNQKRISVQEREVENEKYAFQCFLLRLGFIGEKYKVERKILLKNLTGSSAFKNGENRHCDSEEV